jgi:hypothetical protein
MGWHTTTPEPQRAVQDVEELLAGELTLLLSNRNTSQANAKQWKD